MSVTPIAPITPGPATRRAAGPRTVGPRAAGGRSAPPWTVGRVATAVWLGVSAVNTVVWFAVSVVSGSVDAPWFLWAFTVGGIAVAGIRSAEHVFGHGRSTSSTS